VTTRAIASVATVWLTTVLAVVSGSPTLAKRGAAYPDGAPPGFSGGFNEQSCHACHFHAEPNAQGGSVSIEGVPERYVSGQRYTLAVKLTRPGAQLAGFQLAARQKDDGAQAGTLAPGPTDTDRVGIDHQGGIEYANQRSGGTAKLSAQGATWTIVWTAPAANVPVTFHVAANAADGDGTVEGDYVYSARAESLPAKSALEISAPPR
jgi:hypothetical protein